MLRSSDKLSANSDIPMYVCCHYCNMDKGKYFLYLSTFEGEFIATLYAVTFDVYKSDLYTCKCVGKATIDIHEPVHAAKTLETQGEVTSSHLLPL